MFMSLAARGEGCGGEMVARGLRYSIKGVDKPSGTTRWFGRNLRASGFGVPSVWMKMVRTPLPTPASPGAVAGRARSCTRGREEDVAVGSWVRTVLRGRVHRGAAREVVSVADRVRVASVRDTTRGALEDAMTQFRKLD